ncbi:sigma-70 family RNA polymerase sigma factor [Agriterribacter sp.]|uniref:RNA polymerase sigma factor n=1 Tax=Agriterribacter sp. TaxID=2821509 RepID=UPI002CC581F0|nr:sigma-70 family RNA polymerase sigma factor [Agriterribacter sp.]HRO45472.1 sigma-70 family RNA polymerase sigma factor [Agriterribacter sp.]HRQ18889.1 sigma-70 family RNA polymerase sigma factor [Agriterribacter sp.]
MADYNYQNDAACWRQLKEGNAEALGYLYDTYIDRLFHAALKMTDNRELAKDALQEIFIEIWHYRVSIGDVNHSYSYLVKVLKSIILKKVKRKLIVNELHDNEQGLAETHNIEEMIISSERVTEQKSRLNMALAQLTSRQKQVVRLRFFEGLTYEQIAVKLSMNYQSVNNLAFRAMINLRKQMC